MFSFQSTHATQATHAKHRKVTDCNTHMRHRGSMRSVMDGTHIAVQCSALYCIAGKQLIAITHLHYVRWFKKHLIKTKISQFHDALSLSLQLSVWQ